MKYKFEKLEVWKLAIKLADLAYLISDALPQKEKFNLNSQLRRAVTSIALNIAEGSTSQSNGEQIRFLSYAIRSLIESIACVRLIESRNYLNSDQRPVSDFHRVSSTLFGKLQAFRKSLS